LFSVKLALATFACYVGVRSQRLTIKKQYCTQRVSNAVSNQLWLLCINSLLGIEIAIKSPATWRSGGVGVRESGANPIPLLALNGLKKNQRLRKQLRRYTGYKAEECSNHAR